MLESKWWQKYFPQEPEPGLPIDFLKEIEWVRDCEDDGVFQKQTKELLSTQGRVIKSLPEICPNFVPDERNQRSVEELTRLIERINQLATKGTLTLNIFRALVISIGQLFEGSTFVL